MAPLIPGDVTAEGRMSATTFIDPSGTTVVLLRKTVTLPGTSGYVYIQSVMRAVGGNTASVLCVPFNLPPPTNSTWIHLQHVALHSPSRLHSALVSAVSEWAVAQASANYAGIHGRSTLKVEPFPPQQSVSYLLSYAYTVAEFDDAMVSWRWCSLCDELYHEHIDGRCNLYLGRDFLTESPAALNAVQRIVQFNNALPGWLEECADAIYAMALEKLSEQKTSAYTGGHARGEFTPFLDVTEARGSAATGDGAGDPVPGERGDHGDR